MYHQRLWQNQMLKALFYTLLIQNTVFLIDAKQPHNKDLSLKMNLNTQLLLYFDQEIQNNI